MKKYICDICNYSTTNSSNYSRHMNSIKHEKCIHEYNIEVENNKNTVTENIHAVTCGYCQRSFP